MIRPFTIFCKLNQISFSDRQWFEQEAGSLSHTDGVCPVCHAKACLSPFASYTRYLVEWKEDFPVTYEVTVQRYRCSSCGHTHAQLPSPLVPYSSYSLRFILLVLRDYFLHRACVQKICEHAGISVSTLYRWKALFLAHKALWLGMLEDLKASAEAFLDGMEALVPRTRCDKGGTRVIPEEAEREIRGLRKEYPRLNATQVREKLVQEGTLPATVSVSTIQRYIKHNGLKSPEDASVKDRKAYEEEYFGGMWQADTCYLPYIRENGKSRRVYLIMILDDHSRMIVGGKLYYQENAANFQKTLKEAIAAYGIPNKLYVDNGSPYSNDQLSFICGSVGTVLLHTPVRDGASKGKVERNFRTLKERWPYGLDVSQIQGLKEFNRLLSEYIRRHNTAKHGSTGQSPLERYMATNGRIRRPQSREWLDEAFHNRVIRNVNRDAAVHLLNECYDAPMQFIGQKVEVRFLPGDTGSAYILYGGQHYPLRLTDRVANGRTKRQAALSIDYAKEGREDVH